MAADTCLTADPEVSSSFRPRANTCLTAVPGVSSSILARSHTYALGKIKWEFVCCLFDLILYVPSTIFQLNRDGSSWDKCVLLNDHNAVMPVRLEPADPRSRVKHSTTEPLRSLKNGYKIIISS